MKKFFKQNNNKERISKKISNALDISSDMLSDIPRITLNDNKELQIENYKGVLSYSMDKITLGAKRYIIEITGRKLKIIVITDEDITIEGNISAVTFSTLKKE